MWPFNRREKRDFTVVSTDRAIAAAFGNTDTADVAGTAAATTAMGIMSRSFAAAAVLPSVERTGLTPSVLAEIGASFVAAGESVWLIDVVNGRVKLYRAASWDIEGGPFDQLYRVTIPGPTRQIDRTVPADGVLHPRINCSASAPYKGRSPLQLAGFSAKALANAERQLSEEFSGPVGRVLPAPLDSLQGQDANGNSPLDELVGDLANLKGGTAVVPSMAKDWADLAGGSAPNWQSRRIGAEPPLSVVQARGEGHSHLLASCGVPPGLFETRDAGAARESLRMFLHTTVSPWARVLESEAREKLNAAVTLDFVALHASDVQGRARAARALVQAGFSLAEAAAASGILQPET